MILLVDIGNARLKWAFYQEGLCANPEGIFHKGRSSEALLEETWQFISAPSSLWVSNVAGSSFQEALLTWARKRGQIPVHFARSLTKQCGIQNGYEKPEQLGVDRWLALLAARQHCSFPFCVVDYGSALTLDVVDQHGRHLGGHILPGWHVWIRALKVQFPHLELDESPPSLEQTCTLARNTMEGVKSGCLTSMLGTLHFLFHRLTETLGTSLQWVITGGDAPLLIPHLSFPVLHKPYLVLEGLGVYQRSACSK